MGQSSSQMNQDKIGHYDQREIDNEVAATQLLDNATKCATKKDRRKIKRRRKDKVLRGEGADKRKEANARLLENFVNVNDDKYRYISPAITPTNSDHEKTTNCQNEEPQPHNDDNDTSLATGRSRKRKRERFEGKSTEPFLSPLHTPEVPLNRTGMINKQPILSKSNWHEPSKCHMSNESFSSDQLPTTGPFVQREIELLADAIEQLRKELRISQYALNEKIQNDNGNKSRGNNIWDEIVTVLPHRNRQSVMKVVRRRWHNYSSRGKWTSSEDRMLRDAYDLKPNRWKEIGALIGRMPEDCRDRWRNYVKYGDRLKKDIWSESEEKQLIEAVHQSLYKIQKLQAKETKRHKHQGLPILDHPPPASLLNWGVISDMMGGQRSRLQCSNKWRVIRAKPEEESLAVVRGSSGKSSAAMKRPQKNRKQRQPQYRTEEKATSVLLNEE